MEAKLREELQSQEAEISRLREELELPKESARVSDTLAYSIHMHACTRVM